MAPRISPPTSQPLNTSQPSQPPQRTQMPQGVANTPTSLSLSQQEGLCAKLRKIIESIKECLSRLFPISPKEAQSSSQSNQAPIPPSISTPLPSLQQGVIGGQSPTTSEKPNSPHINPPLITTSPVQPLPQTGEQPTAPDLVVVRPPLNPLDAAGQTPLENACRRGDLEDARALIQAGALNTEPADNLRNTLFYLCESQQVELLRTYTNARVNLDQRDHENNSLIHVAVVAQNPQIVGLLIDGGAPIDQQNNAGDTPLLIASNLDNPGVVQALIRPRANIRYRPDLRVRSQRLVGENGQRVERTPIEIACANNNAEIVRLLIQADSMNDLPDENHPILRCLTTASENNNLPMIRALTSAEGQIPPRVLLHLMSLGLQALFPTLIHAGVGINSPDDRGNTPLHIACFAGEEGNVATLLRFGADPTLRNREGNTPLHIAVQRGHLNISRRLIQTQPNLLNQINNNNNTPLDYAFERRIESNQNPATLEMIQLLLDSQQDPNAAMENRGNSMGYALLRGDQALFELLLQIPNINRSAKERNGDTPLHLAALRGSLQNIQDLIQRGGEIDPFNTRNATPLHYAAMSEINPAEKVQMLLANGFEINAQDHAQQTPLHCACIVNRELSVAALLASGANLNLGDREGNTALHFACIANGELNVAALLASGATPNLGNREGNTPLHLAAIRCNTNIMQRLINAQPDLVNQADIHQETPLHYAYRARTDRRPGNFQAIEFLLNNGANPNAKINGEITLLHMAITHEDEDLFQLLCRRPNIDPNVPSAIGNTPLHSAAHMSSFENMAHLIQLGANMDAIDGEQANTLHYAARSRRDSARKIQFLLENQFRIHAQDQNGMTPLHHAYQAGNQPAIDALIRRGADQNIQDRDGRIPAALDQRE